QVGRELGVRYVLEGSVRKAAARLRITGQLIDTTSDRHIWADRFDSPIEEVFDLQDQVTAQVIAAIEPALAGAEMERARAKHPSSLTAYDCFLRALVALRAPTKSGPKGRTPTQQAIADVRELAREHTVEAIDTLVSIATDTKSPAAARVEPPSQSSTGAGASPGNKWKSSTRRRRWRSRWT